MVTHASRSKMLFSGKNKTHEENVLGHMVLQEERDAALSEDSKDEKLREEKEGREAPDPVSAAVRVSSYDPGHPAPDPASRPMSMLCSAIKNLVMHHYDPISFNNLPQGSHCLHLNCQT